jgi:hypothetical protein
MNRNYRYSLNFVAAFEFFIAELLRPLIDLVSFFLYRGWDNFFGLF